MSTRAQHKMDLAVIRNRREAEIEQAKADWSAVQPRCAETGINITYSLTGARGIRATHFMFWRETWKVGDYWPTTGLVRIADGSTSSVESLAEALERVYVKVGPPKPGPHQHGPRPKGDSQRQYRSHPVGTADRPEPARRCRKPRRHESRQSEMAGSLKTLRKMIEGAIRRHRKINGDIPVGEIRAALITVAEKLS